jgi:carboxypeptidase C (cathepsin A)
MDCRLADRKATGGKPFMKKFHLVSILGCMLFFLLLGVPDLRSSVICSTKEAKKSVPETSKEVIEKPSVTHHSIEINGENCSYSATAGYLPMKDESGKVNANIFFTAYVKEEEGEASRRPLTFAFNGGPGAASIFLHLGALGPKRILLTEKGEAPPPPYKLVDNACTWLEFTDLVFIDPVGTGYSRPAEGVDPKEFWGVKEDIRSIGEFIRLFLTKYNRWLSPKFIVGESYGTTRAAGLSNYLQNKLGINLNGIVLISEALNFQAIVFTPGNDLPYILYLPTFTTTAWYHKKLPPDLLMNRNNTQEEVEQFALGEYLLALAKGDGLPDSERNKVIEKLARYTGLAKNEVKNRDLRIPRDVFVKELLRSEHRHVGVLDSRITGRYTPQDFIQDPSVFAVTGPLVATWNAYVRGELKYETDLPYEILSTKANESWNWSSATKGLGYVNVVDTLSQAMQENQYLKVMVASGYYDLDTPYFAAKYAINHLDLEPSLRKNVTLKYYEGGHQMYTNLPSLMKLSADASQFYKETSQTPGNEISKGR